MKIWTITTDDDNGTQTAIHTTQAAAEAKAREIVAAWFARHVAEDGEERDHDDWRESYEILCDTVGFMNCLTIEEHDITTHPAVREALAALDLAQERLRMNDIDGEELPFIHDCAVAVAMLTDAEPPQMDEATAAACTAEFGEE